MIQYSAKINLSVVEAVSTYMRLDECAIYREG